MKNTILLNLALVLFISVSASAVTRLVPDEYTTIQAAIDNSTDGDVVIIAPGTYTGDGNHDIEFQGKAIAVCSEDRPESTIIDCSGADLGFCIIGNEIGHSTIEGLTIRNAVQAAVKVRAVILFRSPGEYQRQYQFSDLPTHTPVTIRNCHIVDNPGCGIILDSHDNITITNCRITNNGGAGVWSYRRFPTIRNCLIAANDGHGIRATGATVINCTVAENAGIGLWMYEGSVINTIIWANAQQQIYDPDNNVEVAYSDIQGSFPGTGNIDSNPLFIVARDNYRLQIGSPCIDAGDPDYIPEANETDLDTNPRIGNGRIDIGAYEYQNQRTIYVDVSGTSDFATIQSAIDDANDGEVVIVKPGTYTGDGNRDIDFQGKAITVRSEQGPETCIIDCQGSLNDRHRGFYFHRGEDADSVVAGFTIVNGFGLDEQFSNTEWSFGGSIYCEQSGPTITDCIIKSNKAIQGAGIFAWKDSSPTITKCTITANRSPNGNGGGIYCWRNTTVIITDCVISGNDGRGIDCWDSPSATIVNCTITNNDMDGIDSSDDGALTITNCTISDNRGPGIRASVRGTGTATISNCIITGNTGSYGGGIRLATHDNCFAAITNCTIACNSARVGGGIFCESTGDTILTNSIMRNNISSKRGHDIYVCNFVMPPNGDWTTEPTKLTVSYSCLGVISVEEDPIFGDPVLTWGAGNMDADPCFADPGYWDPNGTPEDASDDFWVDGDYHLKSQAGRWDPNAQSWVRNDVTSPCIDAGDPMLPIGYESFPNGGRINMGAYGGTIEASKSYFGEPLCGTVIAGDINGDCKVNFADFEIMALHWLQNNR